MPEEIQVPPRVLALAEKFGDTPVAWKEHEDGSITIVFCNKGKQTFEKTAEIEEVEEVLTVITTKAEAEEAVGRLTPTHKPSPKRKVN
jgi:hypothetical protein